MSSTALQGRKIAILAADGVEQVELEQPRQAVQDAGARVDLLSICDGEIQAMNHDIEPGETFEVDRLVFDASIDDYDGLILPGGTINPDKLRADADAIAFVREFVQSGRTVGVIWHGPSLVEADVVRRRRITSWPTIRTDLRNAGAEVVDERVVIDGAIISSRSPDDLPAFCAAIVEQFAAAASG